MHNFSEFIQAHILSSTQRILSAISILITLFAIPLSLLLLGERQDIRQRASEGAETVVSGTFSSAVFDDFENETSIERDVLIDAEGNETNIALTEDQKASVSPGDRITALRRDDGSIEIESVTRGTTSRSPGDNPMSAIGTKKVPVILVNFTNSMEHNVTREYVEENVVEGIKKYFHTVSYDKIKMEMDVFGWYTVPPPPEDKNCFQSNQWVRDALETADPDIDFSDIDRFLILFSSNDQCYGGYAMYYPQLQVETDEGPRTMAMAWAWYDVEWIDLPNSSVNIAATDKAIHEVLHTFGIKHANRYHCEGGSFTPHPCESIEYGSPFNVMGSYNQTWSISAQDKYFLNWLDDSQVTTVRQSGTYTIAPLGPSDNNVKALRILRGEKYLNQYPQYIYIEYRQPTYPDTYDVLGFPWMTTNIYEGGLVHIDNSEAFYPDWSLPSQLVKPLPQPEGETNFKYALLPNSPLTDPLSGITMTVTTITPESLTVHVTIPSSTPTPTITPSPTPTIALTSTPSQIPISKPIPCSKYGDINNDGVITSQDSAAIGQIVTGFEGYEQWQKDRADVNGDTRVTLQDQFIVTQYLQSLISTFPVCSIPTPTPTILQCNKTPVCSGNCVTAIANSCSPGNGIQTNCFLTTHSTGANCVHTQTTNQPCQVNNCNTGYTCSNGLCVQPTSTQTPTMTPSPTNAPSLTSTPLGCDPVKDGVPDIRDYSRFIDELRGNLPTLSSDCNKNGRIDLFDYTIWLQSLIENRR